MFTSNMETSLLTPRSTKFGGKHGTNVQKINQGKLEGWWPYKRNGDRSIDFQGSSTRRDVSKVVCSWVLLYRRLHEHSVNNQWRLSVGDKFTFCASRTVNNLPSEVLCLKYPTHNEERNIDFVILLLVNIRSSHDMYHTHNINASKDDSNAYC